MMRTRVFRLMVPSITIQPAMVPTLLILNVSRTSTVHAISSLTSGDNMPDMASRMSLMES